MRKLLFFLLLLTSPCFAEPPSIGDANAIILGSEITSVNGFKVGMTTVINKNGQVAIDAFGLGIGVTKVTGGLNDGTSHPLYETPAHKVGEFGTYTLATDTLAVGGAVVGGTLSGGVVASGAAPALNVSTVGGFWSDYYGPPGYNDGEIDVSLPGINEQAAVFYASNVPGSSDLESIFSLRPPSGSSSDGLDISQVEVGAATDVSNQTLSASVLARAGLTAGLYVGSAGGPVNVFAGGRALTDVKARFDSTVTAGQTALLLWDVDNGTLERVTVGAADSGGAGFKLLRIAN